MRRGFTLIEAVIAIFILGIVAAGLIPILSKGIEAFSYGMSSQEDLAKARIAMARMANELKDAKAVCYCNCGDVTTNNYITFIKPYTDTLDYYIGLQYLVSSKEIILTKYSIAKDGGCTATKTLLSNNRLIDSIKAGSFCTAVYRQDGTEKTCNGSYVDNPPIWRVRIRFSIEKKSGGELPFETQVVLRQRMQ